MVDKEEVVEKKQEKQALKESSPEPDPMDTRNFGEEGDNTPQYPEWRPRGDG